MKKTIITSLFMCLAVVTNAQMITDSTSSLKIDSSQLAHSYLKKSRNQKLAAWALVSVGFYITLSGIVAGVWQGTFTSAGEPGHNNNPAIATAIGGTIMCSSIPLFIAGHKNKQKAHLYSNGHHAMISPRIQVGRIYSAGMTVQL